MILRCLYNACIDTQTDMSISCVFLFANEPVTMLNFTILRKVE